MLHFKRFSGLSLKIIKNNGSATLFLIKSWKRVTLQACLLVLGENHGKRLECHTFPWIQDPGWRILDPGSWIQDPGSRIPDHGSWIQDPDPGSRILDPGSWSRILDHGSWITDPGSRVLILDHGSWITEPRSRISWIQDPGSRIRDPWVP